MLVCRVQHAKLVFLGQMFGEEGKKLKDMQAEDVKSKADRAAVGCDDRDKLSVMVSSART